MVDIYDQRLVRDTLIKARRRLGGGKRWCRRRMRDGRTKRWSKVCSAGAVAWSITGDPTRAPRPSDPGNRLYMTTLECLREASGDTAPIWCWNDRYGRTPKEVLAVFDKAIEMVSGDIK